MSKFSNIKTGVIGVGVMGNYHSNIYSSLSNLVGVSDANEELGKQVANKYGVKFFSDYKELIDKVDAVSIAVPTKFHFEVTKLAIERGVNALVEKPLCSSPELSRKIYNLSKSNNVTVSVGHIERFNPVITKFRQLLAESSEKVLSISASRFSARPTRINDVGVIYDLSIHDIDLICFIFGLFPVNISCSAFSASGNEEHVKLLMEFDGEQVGSCETSWLSNENLRRLEILTDKNFWVLDLLDLKIIKSNNLEGKSILEVEKVNALEAEITNFLTSTTEKNSSPLVTALDGLKAVTIAEACIKSYKERNVIRLGNINQTKSY